MTNEEMSELDQWLAENVMGWRFRKRIPHVFGAPPAYVIDIGTEEQDFVMYVEDWTPTRNIAQAFEVVEKMEKNGFCFELSDSPFQTWDAIFEFQLNKKEFAIGAIETPALAICLAAKKAWEAK